MAAHSLATPLHTLTHYTGPGDPLAHCFFPPTGHHLGDCMVLCVKTGSAAVYSRFKRSKQLPVCHVHGKAIHGSIRELHLRPSSVSDNYSLLCQAWTLAANDTHYILHHPRNYRMLTVSSLWYLNSQAHLPLCWAWVGNIIKHPLIMEIKFLLSIILFTNIELLQ